MTENYLGFYTKDPFWTISKPDISTIKNNDTAFREALSEVLIKYSDDEFHIEICRDGLIILKIHRLENLRKSISKANSHKHDHILEFNSEYLSYLNSFQFLLASATYHLQKFNYFRNGSLSSHEIFNITKKNGKVESVGLPYRDISQQLLLGRYLSDYNKERPIEIDYRIQRRSVIEEMVFTQCIEDFKSVIKHEDSFFILSQINSSFSEFSNLNFRQSLTLAWFCIEYFINKIWIDHLHEKKESKKGINRINSDRRKTLLGKDFTSSIMINLLELDDKLPLEIFTKIDNVRAKRNLVVHNLDRVKKLSDKLKEKPENKDIQPIQLLDCLDAFDSLIYFCKTFYNIDIRFPVGFTYTPL